VILLGIDTATPATAVALVDSGDGPPGRCGRERRHDPGPGERPAHNAQLLALASDLLRDAGLRFADVDRVAVGLGPGSFTGLRIGVATARALAQAAAAQIVGVSSLAALAAAAPVVPAGSRGVLALIDARRGEVFGAGFSGSRRVLDPFVAAPGELGALAGAGWLAVGDGAVRFRSDLEGAGCDVPADESREHRVSALAVCELALDVSEGTPLELVVPDYLRPPDAVKTRR
jgi:tRNA threonylcarbamoyladenosine biosynthesis protein TsaB